MVADYKSMYYHLSGRNATAVDVLEATTSIMEANAKAVMTSIDALKELKEKTQIRTAGHRGHVFEQ